MFYEVCFTIKSPVTVAVEAIDENEAIRKAKEELLDSDDDIEIDCVEWVESFIDKI